MYDLDDAKEGIDVIVRADGESPPTVVIVASVRSAAGRSQSACTMTLDQADKLADRIKAAVARVRRLSGGGG